MPKTPPSYPPTLSTTPSPSVQGDRLPTAFQRQRVFSPTTSQLPPRPPLSILPAFFSDSVHKRNDAVRFHSALPTWVRKYFELTSHRGEPLTLTAPDCLRHWRGARGPVFPPPLLNRRGVHSPRFPPTSNTSPRTHSYSSTRRPLAFLG